MSRKRWIGLSVATVCCVGLWWPPAHAAEPIETREPFVWAADELWRSLETQFDSARSQGCGDNALRDLEVDLASLEQGADAVEVPLEVPPSDAHSESLRLVLLRADERRARQATRGQLLALESTVFRSAAQAAACPELAPRFLAQVPRAWMAAHRRTVNWNRGDANTLRDIYRARYGLRAAAEHVLLQLPDSTAHVLMKFDERTLEVPSISLHGVTLQSGDILLSRGGAPTSALIARGNDRPANFSHVALLHVDVAGEAHVIESHIESGVGVFSPEQYLKDTKLRIMVLRFEPEAAAIRTTPDLPHRAATAALSNANNDPAPYDFAMEYEDPGAMFCSEVVFHAYRAQGVELWDGLSSLSSPGVGRWLAALGVEEFETLAPSDVEYDSRLRVVAEWRDPTALFDDQLDNAIIDALLERAESGLDLEFHPLLLGPARVLKAHSVIASAMGMRGAIPTGMSAATALRVRRLDSLHQSVREPMTHQIAEFEAEHGYKPPYWRLVDMAREALAGLL